jgi:hypothetical protein
MTRSEALDHARELAATRGWTWREPVVARWGRRWLLGRGCWTVLSNAESRGCNVRVVIDDATGDLIEAGFNPR